jgi:hypothetical protein
MTLSIEPQKRGRVASNLMISGAKSSRLDSERGNEVPPYEQFSIQRTILITSSRLGSRQNEDMEMCLACKGNGRHGIGLEADFKKIIK